MALSEKEQRLLAQLEAAITAEDPTFANRLRGTGTYTLHRRRAAASGVAFVLGIIALVVGMEVGWVLSVAGFAVMLAATIVALSAWKHVEGQDAPSAREPRGHPDLFDRLEERWRRPDDTP